MPEVKPLYFNTFGEARCPWCNCELYAMAVSHYMTKGADCHNCGRYIKGETVVWSSIDGIGIPLCNMELQHLSNVLHYCESKGSKSTIKYIKKEFERRGIEPLPYKPYYEETIEEHIYNIT